MELEDPGSLNISVEMDGLAVDFLRGVHEHICHGSHHNQSPMELPWEITDVLLFRKVTFGLT